ncbi:MAG: DUF4065 domain-containing protein [Fimbriimonadaceae bacterium]|nr:DUF4065 domain-containing protein [Fimbriimonadaceae bacterium]
MPRYTPEQRALRARDRAKRTILALVNANGGELVGKLRLYKAFYRAHLDYFRATGLELTGYPIVRMPNGPGIDNATDLIDEMRASGDLTEEIGTRGLEFERAYRARRDNLAELDADQLQAVHSAVQWANSLSSAELSEASHQASWHETVNGQEQPILIDALSAEELVARRSEARARLAAVTPANVRA